MLDTIFGLHGQVAIVTGAGRGIGRAAALALAGAGAAVGLVSRTRAELEALAEEIEAAGGRAFVHVADLGLPAEAPAIVAAVEAGLGPVTILVNNAGLSIHETVREMTRSAHERHMAVNLESPVALCRAVIERLIAQGRGGKIINITSLAGFRAFADHASYGMSKAALASFSRTLAIEMARAGHDIQVNCLAPGAVLTSIDASAETQIDPATTEMRVTRVLSLISAGRPSQPEELQGLIILLASKASSYVTGQEIVVDGGWTSDSGWLPEQGHRPT